MSLTQNRLGFSLIELVVVISIIGILSSIGMSSYVQLSQRGRDDRRILDVEALRDALKKYYHNQPGGFYPRTINEIVTGNYIDRLPVDPQSGLSSAYQYSPLPAGCNNTAGNYCLQFTISVPLERKGSSYSVQSDSIRGTIHP